jgi:hypothetical protein
MDSSNEFNYKNEIEDHLYDVNENIKERIEMHEIFKYSLIANSGDVIDNNENLQSSIKSQLKHDQFDDKKNIILTEKTDLKEPLLIHNKSQDINPITEYSYENNQSIKS